MNSKIIAIGLLALTAATVVFYPSVRANIQTLLPIGGLPPDNLVVNPVASPAPSIEVVFVLDTTGSMSGLIDAAKDKIWSIASSMASADPAPEIRIGLVAYRDRGDEYVTRVVDLSDDLDSVYATLIDFEADGGGDGPESVNQALHDAIHHISWSRNPDSYQVVFLVGDAPAHMDYPDDVKHPLVLAEAARRGIVVNAIRCGSNAQTEAQWRTIASATQGAYFSVEQTGSAIAVVTPFDRELANLSRALDDTRLYYGDEREQAATRQKLAATEKLHANASDAAKARRATFNVSTSGEKNLFGDADLVSAVTAGEVKLDEIEADQLPEPLQRMTAEGREELVRSHHRQREALTSQIRALSGQRASYLAAEVGASKDKEASLDHQIYETVRKQAGKKGLEYAGSPQY